MHGIKHLLRRTRGEEKPTLHVASFPPSLRKELREVRYCSPHKALCLNDEIIGLSSSSQREREREQIVSWRPSPSPPRGGIIPRPESPGKLHNLFIQPRMKEPHYLPFPYFIKRGSEKKGVSFTPFRIPPYTLLSSF